MSRLGKGKGGNRFAVAATKRPNVIGGGRPKGMWKCICRDKDGNVKWEDEFENIVVDEGCNYLLDAGLSGGTQITAWYVGLIDGTSPAPVAADTLASHSGWTENTNYTGDRQAWTDAGVSSKSVDNSASKASFSINADSQTIGGAFLCSASTGTTGTLYAAGAFSGGDKSVDSGDTLEVTATFTMADDGA